MNKYSTMKTIVIEDNSQWQKECGQLALDGESFRIENVPRTELDFLLNLPNIFGVTAKWNTDQTAVEFEPIIR